MNKSLIYFLLILLLSITTFIIVLFYYKNSHFLNRLPHCHKNAFSWENKEFYTNHCVCNHGFVGDGKSECSRCGLSSMRDLSVLIVQEYNYVYLSENKSTRNFSYCRKFYGTIISKNLIAASRDSLKLSGFDDELTTIPFIESKNYSKIEDTLRIEVGLKIILIKKIHLSLKHCNFNGDSNEK